MFFFFFGGSSYIFPQHSININIIFGLDIHMLQCQTHLAYVMSTVGRVKTEYGIFQIPLTHHLVTLFSKNVDRPIVSRHKL